MKKTGFHAVLFRRDRSLRIHRRRAGAAGAGRDRVRDGAVHEHQLRRRRARRDHPVGAVLCRPVRAGRHLRRPPQAEGHSARRTAEVLGRHQGGLVLPVRHRAPDGDAAVLQAREPRAVLCDRAAGDPAPMVGTGAVEARQHRGSGAFNRRDLPDALVRRAQRVSVGHVPACRAQRILSGQELGRRALAAIPRTERQDLRRADRHSRRLRPPDRRVLADRRDLQPRQRSVAASPAATPSCCSSCAPSPAWSSGSG